MGTFHVFTGPGQNILQGRARGKYPADTGLNQPGDVVRGDDAPADYGYIGGPLFSELPGYLGEMVPMRSGETAQPDQVDVFLYGGADNLFWSLVHPGVNHFKTGVSVAPGDNPGATVVAVQSRLCNEDS